MNADLVHCTLQRHINIPKGMDKPKSDQMHSTVLDQLGELACRTCYDSLGSGRSSEGLHAHIREVINLSVYEHLTFTVNFAQEPDYEIVRGLINRKGLWFEPRDDDETFDLTVNARTVLEWGRHSLNEWSSPIVEKIGWTLWEHGYRLAPLAFQTPTPNYVNRPIPSLMDASTLREDDLSDQQVFLSLWLYGSRGFTHEQVRHRFAISQRSTRYVDESESPYIEHPVITAYLADTETNLEDQRQVSKAIFASTESDRTTYDLTVEMLQAWLMKKGLQSTPARKQARGAARGYLGNALASEMIFTASVTDWKWILYNRKNALADAEIREVYTPGLQALKESMWGGCFLDFNTGPSPDGIGTVLVK